jgi:hypothetical protein
MKNLFRQINWKVMNLSAWIVVIITYVFPFHYIDNATAKVGFPFSFLSVYKNWNTNLLISFNIDLGSLILNIVIVYLIITVIRKLYNQYQKS